MNKKLPCKLDYYNGENEVPNDAFRISASGISRFFTSTNKWWRENLLDEEGFTGSTASVLGTCVHYLCEQYGKNKKITAEDEKEIDNYILKHTDPEYADYNPEIDADLIYSQYKVMAEAAINDYVSLNVPSEIEPFVSEEVLPNIFVGGSIDNITGSIVVDYKTTSTKATSLPKTIPYAYRCQLLTYAWVLKQQGKQVDRIRVVYITRNDTDRISEKTGKPLTQYPSKAVTLTESITEEDFDTIEGMIQVIAHSVKTWQDQPELRHLLAQDWRLYTKPKPKLFKD